jgi:hypothetical protein
MDLVDAGRKAGWITGNAVGFRGFGDETEAAHAAWIAHRTLTRRLARTHRVRPVPVATEPLTLREVESKEMILASGRPIATLIRPGSESQGDRDSFGFELSIPTPATELQVRALAYLIYRTLRKSGIRWAMWRAEAAKSVGVTTRRVSPGLTTTAPVANSAFVALAVVALLTATAIAPRTVTVPLAVVLTTGIVASMLIARADQWVRSRHRRPIVRRMLTELLLAPAATRGPGDPDAAA